MHRKIRIYQHVCRERLSQLSTTIRPPQQHWQSQVTGPKKLQEDIVAQTCHSAVITKHSTDSVSSKGRNLLTGVKSIYVVLKAVITSYLLFLYELMKIFFFSDDSMPEIFCMKHFYIFPLEYVSRGWTLDEKDCSYLFYCFFYCNSQRSNTKDDEISKALCYLMFSGVQLKVAGFPRISWHNKFLL